VEEEIKKWLKKKLEESPKKEDKQPPKPLKIEPETSSKKSEVIETEEKWIEKSSEAVQIKDLPKESQNFFVQPIQPKEEKKIEPTKYKIEIPQKRIPDVITTIPVKTEVNEKPTEIKNYNKKEGINKILLTVVVCLGAACMVIFLFYSLNFRIPSIFSKTYTYEFSFTHNGKPIEIGPSEIYENVVYGIAFYNKTSSCTNDYLEFSSTNHSSTYIFDSNSKDNEKNIRDYENRRYAFRIYAFQESDNPHTPFLTWDTEIVSKNPLDSNLNYNQLPKLSKDFSITFEIPIFNISSFQKFIDEKNLTVHVELADDWTENNDLYCRFSRIYDSSIDSNLTNCTSDVLETSTQCAKRQEMDCSNTTRVVYVIKAIRNDKSVDCSLQLSELTSGKTYNMRISAELSNSDSSFDNLYQVYYIGVEKITIP
jgi:hypothetical protein